MTHYDDLIQRLRTATKLPLLQALMTEAAEAIEALVAETGGAPSTNCAFTREKPVYDGRYGDCQYHEGCLLHRSESCEEWEAKE